MILAITWHEVAREHKTIDSSVDTQTGAWLIINMKGPHWCVDVGGRVSGVEIGKAAFRLLYSECSSFIVNKTPSFELLVQIINSNNRARNTIQDIFQLL